MYGNRLSLLIQFNNLSLLRFKTTNNEHEKTIQPEFIGFFDCYELQR